MHWVHRGGSLSHLVYCFLQTGLGLHNHILLVMAKSGPYAAIGVLFLSFIIVSFLGQIKSEDPLDTPSKKISTTDEEKQRKLEVGKKVAQNMVIGETILMASCLGRDGSIPRDSMDDYIAAALEKQGISRQELSDNWDKYWGYAKDAEKRNRTSCLG